MASKSKNYSQEQFTKMLRQTVDTPAWRSLSPIAQALYPIIKFEWKGPKANNNGRIRLSYQQAALIMGVRKPHTIGKACAELQARGFLVVTEQAVLGTGGEAKGFAYEITELALPGKDSQGRGLMPRALYKQWRPGHDYPVAKANANNPDGRNGRTKPHATKRHDPMPQMGMKTRSLCRNTA